MDKIVLAIIVVNVIVSLKGFDDARFLDRYKFQVGPVGNGDWFRSISSGFLHVDYWHLLFNMLTLYFFADGVIDHFGVYRFIFIYFMSLIGGSYLSYYFHKNDSYYSAVGASGAVSGVLFSSILLYPFNSLYFMFIPIPIPAIVVGVGYLAYSVFGMKNQWGNIGHAAHLGGAAVGLLLSVLYDPSLIYTKTIYLIILAIPLVLLYLYRDKINL
jgi:membrane associated rhomboid family serine protease